MPDLRKGDIIIVRRERHISGTRVQSCELQEVLAVDPMGYITHTCSVQNPAHEKPADRNTLAFQNIVSVEPMSEDEQQVVRVFPKFAELPLDEPTSEGITPLQALRAIAHARFRFLLRGPNS